MRWILSLLFLISWSVVDGQCTFVSGSNGEDGSFSWGPPFSPIDLGQASEGAWDSVPSVPGAGVYDPQRWVVVFKFSDITVGTGTPPVTFLPHPSGAPVVWLASGNVTIAGTVDVSAGITGPNDPGPGGFAGGRASPFLIPESPAVWASDGFGPGGGYWTTTGPSYYNASHGTPGTNQPSTPFGPLYGTTGIRPLIGGSGGCARLVDWGGASPSVRAGKSGGGAILIASSGTIDIPLGGAIIARGLGGGGDEPGSGGAIRLVACDVIGSGSLDVSVTNHDAGFGRIRIESSNPLSFAGALTPLTSLSTTIGPVFLSAADEVILRVVSIIDGAGTVHSVAADPIAGVETNDLDHPTHPFFEDAGPVTVVIEARNALGGAATIPAGTQVLIRAVPEFDRTIPINGPGGTPLPLSATALLFPDPGSGIPTATASLTFPPGRTEIILRASW